MNINAHFNIKRLINILTLDLKLNLKKYSIIVGVLTTILLAVKLLMIKTNARPFSNVNGKVIENIIGNDECYATFILSLIVYITLAVGTSFPELRSKKGSISYLMLPASTLEKVMGQFIIRIVLALGIFIIMYFTAFKLAILLYELFTPYTLISPNLTPFNTNWMPLTYFEKIVLSLTLLSYACYLLAGCTYFKKHALLKTIMCFGALWVLAFFFAVTLSHIFFPEATNGLEFKTYPRSFSNQDSDSLFFYVIGACSSLFLLPLAYYNLKEKQV